MWGDNVFRFKNEMIIDIWQRIEWDDAGKSEFVIDLAEIKVSFIQTCLGCSHYMRQNSFDEKVIFVAPPFQPFSLTTLPRFLL